MKRLAVLLAIAGALGCLRAEEYPKVHGIEVDGPAELQAAVEVAWPPFAAMLGVRPPWMVREISAAECGCAGAYRPGIVEVVPPYAALPHELAHHASAQLYGHPQSDHAWTPEVRAALNASADLLGMGHEQ